MRKTTIATPLLLFIALFISSCATSEVSKLKTTSFSPNQVKLELTSSDFQYVGEQEVSIDYRTYFCLIKVVDKVNGEDYNSRITKKVNLIGNKDFRFLGTINKALYKVVEKYPDADYFVPVFHKKEKASYFLGSNVTETLTVKVYKLRKL